MKRPKIDQIQQEIDEEALFQAVDSIGRAARAVAALHDPTHPILQITDPVDTIIALHNDPALSRQFVTPEVITLMNSL